MPPTPSGRRDASWRRRLVAGLVLGGVAVGTLVAGRAVAARTPQRPRLPFALPPEARAGLRLVGPAHGRTQVVVYTSAACGHCQEEVSRLARVASAAPDALRRLQLVVVVASSSSADEHNLQVAAPLVRLNDRVGRLAAPLRARAVPTTLVVDRRGYVRAYSIGQHTDSALVQLLRTAARTY